MRKILGSFLMVLVGFVVIYAQETWQPVTEPVKVFSEGYIQVIGGSEEGQTRYRAIRAATVVAQRDLLEVLQGLNLYGTTTIRDGMLQSDTIKTRVEGYLKGATKCGERYDPNRGYAEVCLKLNIRGKGGLYDIILPLMKDEKLLPPKGPTYQPKLIPEVIGEKETPKVASIPKKPEVAPPSELVSPHDGLILDVTEYNFRPALVNRILTDKNELIFGPSKIASSVLLERGCGGFTNDVNKAKALLQSWGAKNPMFVKAKGVVKLTDAQVGSDEAAAIFTHNQRTNFLAQAKVVFLLK